MGADVDGSQRFQYLDIIDGQAIFVNKRTAFNQLFFADDQLLVKEEHCHFSGPTIGRYLKEFALMNHSTVEGRNIASLKKKKNRLRF